MTELEQNIEAYVADKVAAQRRAEGILLALDEGQLRRILDVAANEQAVASIRAVADKLEDIADNHPLGEYLSKRLREASDKAGTDKLNSQLWEMVREIRMTPDNKLFHAAQEVLSGVGLVLVYGDMLTIAERTAVLAPYRAALGPAAAGVETGS